MKGTIRPGIAVGGAFTPQDSAAMHPRDVDAIVDDTGVAVRVGHHCAWPLHQRMNVAATTRASFAAYNTVAEVDALLSALDQVPAVFGVAV